MRGITRCSSKTKVKKSSVMSGMRQEERAKEMYHRSTSCYCVGVGNARERIRKTQ